MKLLSTLLALTLAVSPLAAQSSESAKPVAHSYHITYTITESDSGKPISIQHHTITTTDNGGKSTLKLGNRIPILTGTYSSGGSDKREQQFTYIDVGTSLVATLFTANGPYPAPEGSFYLISKVEQSAVVSNELRGTVLEPVIRQTTIEDSTILTPGVAVRIASLDIPGSTHHFEIDVTLEPVR